MGPEVGTAVVMHSVVSLSYCLVYSSVGSESIAICSMGGHIRNQPSINELIMRSSGAYLAGGKGAGKIVLFEASAMPANIGHEESITGN